MKNFSKLANYLTDNDISQYTDYFVAEVGISEEMLEECKSGHTVHSENDWLLACNNLLARGLLLIEGFSSKEEYKTFLNEKIDWPIEMIEMMDQKGFLPYY